MNIVAVATICLCTVFFGMVNGNYHYTEKWRQGKLPPYFRYFRYIDMRNFGSRWRRSLATPLQENPYGHHSERTPLEPLAQTLRGPNSQNYVFNSLSNGLFKTPYPTSGGGVQNARQYHKVNSMSAFGNRFGSPVNVPRLTPENYMYNRYTIPAQSDRHQHSYAPEQKFSIQLTAKIIPRIYGLPVHGSSNVREFRHLAKDPIIFKTRPIVFLVKIFPETPEKQETTTTTVTANPHAYYSEQGEDKKIEEGMTDGVTVDQFSDRWSFVHSNLELTTASTIVDPMNVRIGKKSLNNRNEDENIDSWEYVTENSSTKQESNMQKTLNRAGKNLSLDKHKLIKYQGFVDSPENKTVYITPGNLPSTTENSTIFSLDNEIPYFNFTTAKETLTEKDTNSMQTEDKLNDVTTEEQTTFVTTVDPKDEINSEKHVLENMYASMTDSERRNYKKIVMKSDLWNHYYIMSNILKNKYSSDFSG